MIIKVVFVFLKYILFGLGFLLSPILGLFYLVCAIGAFLGNRYALRQWYVIDVAIASIIYGTHWRTISGYTGEMAYKHKTKDWQTQEKVIDWLAIKCGDKPKHCYRAYIWEKKSVRGVT